MNTAYDARAFPLSPLGPDPVYANSTTLPVNKRGESSRSIGDRRAPTPSEPYIRSMLFMLTWQNCLLPPTFLCTHYQACLT
jgi:hypothetical protein